MLFAPTKNVLLYAPRAIHNVRTGTYTTLLHWNKHTDFDTAIEPIE